MIAARKKATQMQRVQHLITDDKSLQHLTYEKFAFMVNLR